MKEKIFTIKGVKIKIITSSDGRRAPSPESISALNQLILRHDGALREDKEAIAMGEYLKGNN